MDKKRITVVGAGLAGSLIAVMLARLGFNINLYEKRSDIRKSNSKAGKSINLALSHRGLIALERVGIKQEIMKRVVPMKGRLIHDIKGNTNFQSYGKDTTEVINSVSRRELNTILLSLAEQEENISIFFNHKCTRYETRKNIIYIEDEKGREFTLSPNTIIAADGALSTIRTSLLPADRINFSQNYLEYGYKELEIPPGEGGTFKIEKNALHIWPRESFMMIALPNYDGSFTCTLFAPYKGKYGINNLKTKDDVKSYFDSHFPDTIRHIPKLEEQFFNNPTGKLITIKCEPWNYKNKVLLIGDAAHAIIPFYGQGMNAAFEDCRILAELTEKYEGDFSTIFPKFSQIRKPNADAIAELSYDNFIEMRDKVADKKFLERKKAELLMYEKYHEIISKYAMVTFHPEIPYKIAKLKGEILENTIRKYFNKIQSLDEFDHKEVRKEVLERYNAIENNVVNQGIFTK